MLICFPAIGRPSYLNTRCSINLLLDSSTPLINWSVAGTGTWTYLGELFHILKPAQQDGRSSKPIPEAGNIFQRSGSIPELTPLSLFNLDAFDYYNLQQNCALPRSEVFCYSMFITVTDNLRLKIAELRIATETLFTCQAILKRPPTTKPDRTANILFTFV